MTKLHGTITKVAGDEGRARFIRRDKPPAVSDLGTTATLGVKPVMPPLTGNGNRAATLKSEAEVIAKHRGVCSAPKFFGNAD